MQAVATIRLDGYMDTKTRNNGNTDEIIKKYILKM